MWPQGPFPPLLPHPTTAPQAFSEVFYPKWLAWVSGQRRLFGGTFLNTYYWVLRKRTLKTRRHPQTHSPSQRVRLKAARSVNTAESFRRAWLQMAAGRRKQGEHPATPCDTHQACLLPASTASQDIFHFWTRKQQLHFKSHWLRTEKYNLAWVPCASLLEQIGL